MEDHPELKRQASVICLGREVLKALPSALTLNLVLNLNPVGGAD